MRELLGDHAKIISKTELVRLYFQNKISAIKDKFSYKEYPCKISVKI